MFVGIIALWTLEASLLFNHSLLRATKGHFGPFGVVEGTPFNFKTNISHIVGFYGRGGWFMDLLKFCMH